MSAVISDSLSEQENFYNETFLELNLEETLLLEKVFEGCRFEKCHFRAVQFTRCKFIDCEFLLCDLSNAQLENTNFSEVVFEESKLIGINWTQAKWPLIKLTSPLSFYRSNINHSSFYGLDLQEIILEECKAHGVDFREGNFSGGSFIYTDFESSLFGQTNLSSSDFSEAMGYCIDPRENDIRKAKFSLPDAVGLLYGFDVEIEGI